MAKPSVMGRNLKAARERRGWSQSELARRAGVTQGFVSHLEGGRSQDAKATALHALARALGCTVDALLRDEIEPSAERASRRHE